VKDLKQEKRGCIKHARFKHARFHSAVTPGLIPLTSMGTALIYSIVNKENEACGSSPAEHFIGNMAGSVGSARAMPPLRGRHTLRRFARASRGVPRGRPRRSSSHIDQASPAFTSPSSVSEVSQDK